MSAQRFLFVISLFSLAFFPITAHAAGCNFTAAGDYVCTGKATGATGTKAAPGSKTDISDSSLIAGGGPIDPNAELVKTPITPATKAQEKLLEDAEKKLEKAIKELCPKSSSGRVKAGCRETVAALTPLIKSKTPEEIVAWNGDLVKGSGNKKTFMGTNIKQYINSSEAGAYNPNKPLVTDYDEETGTVTTVNPDGTMTDGEDGAMTDEEYDPSLDPDYVPDPDDP